MVASNNKSPFYVTCKHCSVEYTILADAEDINSWREGAGYIQDILAYLSAAERELLISGTCDNCWNNMFGSDLDDEDD